MQFVEHDKKNFVTRERRTIYLFCMDSDLTEEILQALKSYCQIFFLGLKVEILDQAIDVPKYADRLNIEQRYRKDTGKIQYNATNLLDLIEENFLPDDAYCLIGLMNQDLYPRKGWTFVFGISRLVRRCGVFSLARHDPHFFENMQQESDES